MRCFASSTCYSNQSKSRLTSYEDLNDVERRSHDASFCLKGDSSL
jgi:hypothetical protein